MGKLVGGNEDCRMRLIVLSNRQRLSDYRDFVEALNSLGTEAICVHDLKYCFLGQSKPLNVVPIPRLLGLIKRFNPDFVITDSPYYIPTMVKLADRPVLFHMRGAEEGRLLEKNWDIALYPSLFARMYTLYLAKMAIPWMKKTDLILPNSKWLQEQVQSLLPNSRTRILYVGIDARKWKPNHDISLDIRHPSVVGIFQFTVFSKVLGLLKFVRVVKKMPRVNFYFAGDGPYSSLIKRNCPSNMHMLGRLPISEVKELLESADVFVHPSGLDALPRSVKEASLMEKPIVASNIGGIPEIVKNDETGYLCDNDDVTQWTEKIGYFLDNPDVAEKFGKGARQFVLENFSWTRIAKNFLADLRAFKDW